MRLKKAFSRIGRIVRAILAVPYGRSADGQCRACKSKAAGSNVYGMCEDCYLNEIAVP